MKIDTCPSKEALDEQYGDGYFTRVYRTSLVVFAVAAALVRSRDGLPGLIGLSYGAAISLGGLRAIEIVVRAFFRPGVQLNPKWVTGLMLLKLPLLGVILAGAAWLAVHGLANPFALVGGVALTQAVMFLKAVGSLVVSALPAEPARASAPWLRAELWQAQAALFAAAGEARPRVRPGAAPRGAVHAARGYTAARPEPLPASE